MLRVVQRFIILFILCILYTCIDPYIPELKGYESLLVVDGLITNENTSYSISLSRTMQEQNAIPVKIADATLFITDENKVATFLKNMGEGIYKTDSIEFKGIIGGSYILHIITAGGNEYESEPCTMFPVSEIDSIYFAKDKQFISNGTEIEEGIRIYTDSRGGVNNEYNRWDFEETWKFKVPEPKKFNYIDDSTFIPVPIVYEFCWKSRKSDEVLIHSDYSDQVGNIEREPICFIASDKSDRLMVQYSILLRQYSISKEEYDFWYNLKRVNESGGDIFSSQPFPVISNIHNINDPGEKVLGYFQVSAVTQKRMDIPFSDIVGLDLPFYHYPCERIEMAPEDYPRPPLSTPLTWDDLYEMYCITSDYYFVEPKYIEGTNKLEKMVFALPECANCTLSGSSVKPDFWIDMN